MKNKFTLIFRNISLFTGMLFALQALTAQTSYEVSVTNNVFTPDELTINAGDTVIWTNIEGFHNVNGTTATYPENPDSFGNNTGNGWTYSYIFNTPGEYDYQCDPHVGLGMVGTLTVEEALTTNNLTVNFTGMNPHIGQELFLVVKEKNGGNEVGRLYTTISESFSLMLDGIISGESYEVEFFADHNSNGSYDAPPADHAWSIDLDEVSGDEIINFSHNTDFNDIEWEHRVFVNFSGMNPHVGQELYIALFDNQSGFEVDRESIEVTESFTIDLGDIMAGRSYRLDFFADHNDNDVYDAPPADHAWSLEITDASGDEVIDFTHNTNFTDVDWMHKLKIEFFGMAPHDGQMLTLYLRDKESGEYIDTVVIESIPGSDFEITEFMIEPGSSYYVDFYSDHNGNGQYDAPPADHAWRLDVGTVSGDTDVEFKHNTSFTNIFETTSTRNLDSEKLKIYPVPASEVLNIQTGNVQVNRISVFELSGKEVYQKTIHSQENVIGVNISTLNPGIYILKVTGSDFNEVQRFVKK